MSSDDLDDELSSHIEFQARKHMAAGMAEAEARRQARLEFGGMDATKEQCRDVDPWRRVNAARRNLRYAVRSLVQSPVFTSIAIAILAVGIGATVASFGIVDAVLYRPMAISHPEELVRISLVDPKGRRVRPPSTLVDPLKSSAWLSGVCGFNSSDEGTEVNGTLSTIQIMGFTGDCFRTLGVAVQLGRPILPADDIVGAPRVAVITGEFWRKALGGRADAVGQTIRMPGVSFTIVGVAEDRFTGLVLGFPASAIVPLHQEPNELGVTGVQSWWPVELIGRLAPGVSAKQANAAMAAQTKWLLQQSVPPSYSAGQRRQYLERRMSATLSPGGVDYNLRRRFGNPIYAVFGICALILAIACVNLASLILARALRRRKEVAVRMALGASRAHVAGMLALESSLLVAAGAALSVLFALAVDRAFLALGNQMFGNFSLKLGFDFRVALFFGAVVLGIGCALAGASAFQARRLSRQGDLHESGRGVSHGHGALQKVLIAAQIALTLALVTGAGLFGSSLRSYYHLDLGVKTQHVWGITLAARPAGYQHFVPGPYYRELVQEVEAIPGVAGAVMTNVLPFYTRMDLRPAAIVESSETGQDLDVHTARITDGFFSTLGMRIVEGRDFRRDEGTGTEAVAIVSQSLADIWGGTGAVMGRHVRLGTGAEYQRLTVVGVASDAQVDMSDVAHTRPPTVYVNSWQHPEFMAGYPVMLIRTAAGTLPIGRVRQAVDRLGREYIDRGRSLDAEKDGSLAEDRVMAFVSAAFGVLALVLAATGLFGLLSYQVANRTGEIGIRMALGARRGQIQWLVVRQIGGLLAGGSVAGIVLALLAGKVVSKMLFGVQAGDVRLLAGALAVLAGTALVASWLPARRAASVDPLVALRHE